VGDSQTTSDGAGDPPHEGFPDLRGDLRRSVDFLVEPIRAGGLEADIIDDPAA
jgi:hypothetical protein